MNFWPIMVLAWLTASTANGQGSWSYEESFGGYQARVRDGLELPDGSWVLATMASGAEVGLPGQFWLTRIGGDGELISSVRIWDPGVKTIVSVLQPMDGDRFRAFGTVGDVETTEAYFHYDSNSGLDRLDSGLVTYPGLHRLVVDNAIPLPDGGAVLLGSAADTTLLWNKGIVAHISPDGELLVDHIFQSSSNPLVLRDGLMEPDGSYLISSCKAPLELDEPLAATSVFRLNQDLDWLGGFPTPNIYGGGSIYAEDSVLEDQAHLRRLSSGNLIVSGRLGGWLELGYYHSVIMKIDSIGGLQDMAYFESTFPFDQVAVLSAMCDAPEGGFYFAYVENSELLVQVQFSNVRVLRMDTSLNVTCEWLVEGGEEGAYYYLERIKSTSDGGFVLLGGCRTNGESTSAWAQKFEASDCYSSANEWVQPHQGGVFPNPGSQEFIWKGDVLRSGELRLHDALGRLVWTGAIVNGHVHAEGLLMVPGVYCYEVRDGTGKRYDSGFWVKQ